MCKLWGGMFDTKKRVVASGKSVKNKLVCCYFKWSWYKRAQDKVKIAHYKLTQTNSSSECVLNECNNSIRITGFVWVRCFNLFYTSLKWNRFLICYCFDISLFLFRLSFDCRFLAISLVSNIAVINA